MSCDHCNGITDQMVNMRLSVKIDSNLVNKILKCKKNTKRGKISILHAIAESLVDDDACALWREKSAFIPVNQEIPLEERTCKCPNCGEIICAWCS